MTHVAIFVRVSKGGQDYSRQVADLTTYCQMKGYTVAEVIAEKISGVKNNKDREAIQKLTELASQRKIQKVLVSEVSRLGRKTSEVLQVLELLSELQISVYVQNYNMETLKDDGSRNPISQFLFTMLAEFARLERETLIERIHSGLDGARRKGKKLGRKLGSTTSPEDYLKKYPQVVRQVRAGKSVRDIASICGITVGTVQRVKKTMKDELIS